nr:hypothetical protein BgiMline_020934 [Biomphalaria glabrata]
MSLLINVLKLFYRLFIFVHVASIVYCPSASIIGASPFCLNNASMVPRPSASIIGASPFCLNNASVVPRPSASVMPRWCLVILPPRCHLKTVLLELHTPLRSHLRVNTR